MSKAKTQSVENLTEQGTKKSRNTTLNCNFFLWQEIDISINIDRFLLLSVDNENADLRKSGKTKDENSTGALLSTPSFCGSNLVI